MADDVVVPFEQKSAPGESVVSLITQLLQDAQNGDVQIVAVAYVHSDGDVVYRCSSGDNFYKILGALDGLKFHMLKEKEGGG